MMSFAPITQLARSTDKTRSRRGRDLGCGSYLAESEAEAMRRVEPAHDERYKWFAPSVRRYADDTPHWGTPARPRRFPRSRGVAQKAGSAVRRNNVIDGIKSIEAKYPGSSTS